MEMDLHRAIRSNFKYLPLWRNALPQIYSVLGFTTACPTEVGFAEAVAKWQRSAGPPLLADGILGPSTWQQMKGSLRIPEIPPSSAADACVPLEIKRAEAKQIDKNREILAIPQAPESRRIGQIL